MEITSTARIEAPLERVWAVLRDIPRTARCLPGVTITGQVDEKTYDADVAVKVGPIEMNYRATIRVESLDELTHSAALQVEATDRKGRGSASATVRASAQSEGGSTTITVSQDARIAGVLAQFAGGAIKSVAGRQLAQFAENVRNEVMRGTPAP